MAIDHTRPAKRATRSSQASSSPSAARSTRGATSVTDTPTSYEGFVSGAGSAPLVGARRPAGDQELSEMRHFRTAAVRRVLATAGIAVAGWIAAGAPIWVGM